MLNIINHQRNANSNYVFAKMKKNDYQILERVSYTYNVQTLLVKVKDYIIPLGKSLAVLLKLDIHQCYDLAISLSIIHIREKSYLLFVYKNP